MNKFHEDGYHVAKGLLSTEEVSSLRDEAEEYFKAGGPYVHQDDGNLLPGFAYTDDRLSLLSSLTKDKRIVDLVQSCLGEEDIIFFEHSDLHQNKLTGWHRDILNPPQDRFITASIWSSDEYKIVKVCILLQDHSSNDFGLWMQPGTHDDPYAKGEPTCIHSEIGDVVIFDQRIMHRGQESQYRDHHGDNRYLVTFGFGKDNIFTKEHRLGTIDRQIHQRESLS